jgi:hypothetical protein
MKRPEESPLARMPPQHGIKTLNQLKSDSAVRACRQLALILNRRECAIEI